MIKIMQEEYIKPVITTTNIKLELLCNSCDWDHRGNGNGHHDHGNHNGNDDNDNNWGWNNGHHYGWGD